MASFPATIRPLISLADRLTIVAVVAMAHAVALGVSVRVQPIEPRPGLQEISVVASDEINLDEAAEARAVPASLPAEQSTEPPEAKTEPVDARADVPDTISGDDGAVARPEPVTEPLEEKVEKSEAAVPKPVEEASEPVAEKPKPAASREMLVQYAVLASAAINRMKFYPADARDKGNTGIVEVAFAIDPSGAVTEKRVVKSSGSRVLDEAALRMVATAELPLPPSGRFRGRITINFRMKK